MTKALQIDFKQPPLEPCLEFKEKVVDQCLPQYPETKEKTGLKKSSSQNESQLSLLLEGKKEHKRENPSIK